MTNLNDIRDEYIRDYIKKHRSIQKTIVLLPRKTKFDTWLLPFGFAWKCTIRRPGLIPNYDEWYSEAEYTMLKLKGEI